MASGRLAVGSFDRGKPSDLLMLGARTSSLPLTTPAPCAAPGMSVESSELPLPRIPRFPRPPLVTLDVARDRTAESGARGGFVNVRRVDLVAGYPDGSVSEPFAYDVVERAGIDAVVLVAYQRVGGEHEVFVRSAVRVPLALRDTCTNEDANIWELPAGIIDPGESPRGAAAREIEEELGFHVPHGSLYEFAPWSWPAPSVLAERQYFFCVDVTGMTNDVPSEDGSPLERGGEILRMPLATLLEKCRAGELRDAKTELALRRFAELP